MSTDAEEDEGSRGEKPTCLERYVLRRHEDCDRCMGPADGQEDREAWEPDGEKCPRRCYDVKGRGAVSEESIQRATERATKSNAARAHLAITS